MRLLTIHCRIIFRSQSTFLLPSLLGMQIAPDRIATSGGREGLAGMGRIWPTADCRTALRHSQESRSDCADAKAAGGETRPGSQPGNLAMRPVRAGVHDAFLGQRNRATSSGVLSPALASGVDLQTIEVHRPVRTCAQTR